VTNVPLPGFPGGLFVAMSTDRTFHFYAWDDIAAAAGLK
jgi:3-phytase